MQLKNIFVLLTLVLFCYSCDFLKQNDNQSPLARVNDSYLYTNQINHLVFEGLSKQDSTSLVQNFIKRWATQRLLVDGAIVNLSEEKQQAFNALVNQYKNDLYAKAYTEALIRRSIDTVVTAKAAEEYYNKNKAVFKLNEALVKFRYVHLDENLINYDEIKEHFKRYNKNDKKLLDSISIQFKSYSLNDSIWIKLAHVINKIPAVNTKNKNELLKKTNLVQLKDSLGVYLIHINDVLVRNDTAPMEYVKPTIKQIVINKRKLELIKELEKDITKDAIKNKQFEIYN